MNVFPLLALLPPSGHHLKVISEVVFSSHKVLEKVVELSVGEVVEVETECVVVERGDHVLWVACYVVLKFRILLFQQMKCIRSIILGRYGFIRFKHVHTSKLAYSLNGFLNGSIYS